MTPLPAVVILGNTCIHISSSNNSNIVAEVEEMIDKKFGFKAILRIPYINLYDKYILFGKGFNNPQL